MKKLAEKLKDDYDKATASQEVKELKSAAKLYEELYRKRYEKATILINQKNVDGYMTDISKRIISKSPLHKNKRVTPFAV